jgi:choice-of-anchor B domain-containing protein
VKATLLAAVPGAALLSALPPATAAGVPSDPETSRVQADNIAFRSRFAPYDSYKDIWGYTSPGGRELALLTCRTGTSVVDVTNRRRLRETGFIPGPSATHRDVKTFGHFAYVVNETGGGGLQVISLEDPDAPALVAGGLGGFETAHNLWVDEASATLYVAGADVHNGGVRVYDLASPASPAFRGSWESRYAHDVFAREDVIWVSAIHAEELWIVDISTISTPVTLGVIGNYPDAFTHNAWLTDDGRHVLTTDEQSGAWVRMWNVEDPADWYQTDQYSPLGGARAIPHNVHVRGDLAIVSYYTCGVRVVDISDPENLVEVAHYDTYPRDNRGLFDGCWGVFPFFPASPELLVASDISDGLYVLEMDLPGLARAATERRAAGFRAGGGGAATGRPGLAGAAPNPLRGGSTRLALDLPAGGSVAAWVVDATGRRVRSLARGDWPAGRHGLLWDGRDARGHPVASGIYFIRVEADRRLLSRRVTVLR